MSTKKCAKTLLEKNVGPVTFGMFLRVARDNLEMTQAEMAKELGVTRSAICEIEKGRHLVSPKLAVEIAKKAKLSQKQAVRLCLQDRLNRDKINLVIDGIIEKDKEKLIVPTHTSKSTRRSTGRKR